MKDSITRKEFLRTGTRYAAGFAVGAAGLQFLQSNSAKASNVAYTWPWTYTHLDTEVVRKLGHDSYWSGKGCGYGAFHAIMQALRDVAGEPFTLVPSELMLFGHGGAAEWGTLCGALNGSAAAISLVTPKATSDKLVSELLGWYTQVDLPTATSNQYAVDHVYTDQRYDQTLIQNKSGSALCHVSVTEWCVTSKFKVSDVARKERCARLTGDVAAYAVQLLNDNLSSQFNPLYIQPASLTECGACHGSGMLDNVGSTMECKQCHGDPHHTSPVEQIGSLAIAFDLKPNYPNPFNPSTNVQFTVPKGEHIKLTVFDAHGRLIKRIIDGEYYSPGVYRATWDGTSDFGLPITSGSYFLRMQAGEFSKTRKMIMVK